MPRPSLNRERINITIPPDVLKQVDDLADSRGKTRSDVIEEACRLMLKRERKRGK